MAKKAGHGKKGIRHKMKRISKKKRMYKAKIRK
jgi:hypothetical protein